MMDPYPMGILKNTVTGKYHPIAFRQNPMPGLADLGPDSTGHRYRTNHVDGWKHKPLEATNETECHTMDG